MLGSRPIPQNGRLLRRTRPSGSAPLLLALGTTIALMACAERPEPNPAAGPTESAPAPLLRLRGAGASLPAPVYSRWAAAYAAEARVRVEYRQVGSRAGIEAVQQGRVDFGATDIPLDPEALEESGLLQFPVVVGGLVPVVNLPGVGPGDLVLDLPLLADIYRGAVTRWDDPAITALNPELELPSEAILAVHQDEPSGTTWILTHNLAQASPTWARSIGYGDSVAWPRGIGARNNQQALDFVNHFERTLAFVELTRAIRNELSWVSLRQPDGNVVQPSAESFARAAEGWFGSPDEAFRFDTAQAGTSEGWPFTNASYALIRADTSDPARARALLDFFDWTWTRGRSITLEFDYVPLTPELLPSLRELLAEGVTDDGAPVWSPPAHPLGPAQPEAAPAPAADDAAAEPPQQVEP
jgi:phosphate transport system substrate-binding protein